jgi:integrase
MSHLTLFRPDDGSAPHPRSVRGVIDRYQEHLRKRVDAGDYSAHAFDDACRALDNFASSHGNRLVSECQKGDLLNWLDDNPQWRSAWTKKRVASTILAAFNWADERDVIPSNPFRAPKKMRNGRPRRPATDKEYCALMRCRSRPLRRALFFLRRSGARTCEMRELLWTQIDWERCVLVFEEHKTIDQQQEPRTRLIGLDRATVRFLANLYRRRLPGQLRVFVNSEGTPWDRHTFARHMHRWAERVGLDPTRVKLSAYCLRHTYGTKAIEAGVGERQLADQMGHTTTRMVSYYAQTAGKADHLRRIAEAALRRPKK